MKKNKVVSHGDLPSKPPLWSTVITFMAADYYNFHPYLVGAFIFAFIIIWAVSIFAIWNQEQTEIFRESEKSKGKFQRKRKVKREISART